MTEADSDIIRAVPKSLADRAIVLAGEHAWEAAAALQVIRHLALQGIATVGVELWRAEGNSPRWIASSDYECRRDAGWSSYVKSCAESAARFVERFHNEPGALFNQTWVRESELVGS